MTQYPNGKCDGCDNCGAKEVYNSGKCICMDDYYNDSLGSINCVLSQYLGFKDGRPDLNPNTTCQTCGRCVVCKRGEVAVSKNYSLSPIDSASGASLNELRKTQSNYDGSTMNTVFSCPVPEACPGEHDLFLAESALELKGAITQKALDNTVEEIARNTSAFVQSQYEQTVETSIAVRGELNFTCNSVQCRANAWALRLAVARATNIRVDGVSLGVRLRLRRLESSNTLITVPLRLTSSRDMRDDLKPRSFREAFLTSYQLIRGGLAVNSEPLPRHLTNANATLPQMEDVTLAAVDMQTYTTSVLLTYSITTSTLEARAAFCKSLTPAGAAFFVSAQDNIRVQMDASLNCSANVSSTASTCKIGFGGPLCASCADSYLKVVQSGKEGSKLQCTYCQPLDGAAKGTIFLNLAALVGGALLLIFIIQWLICRCRCSRKITVRLKTLFNRAFRSVQEDLKHAHSHAKILVGLGQIVSLLGAALQATWKPDFQAFVDFLQMLTNIDVLAFLGFMPSLGCLMGTVDYTRRFWFSILSPVILLSLGYWKIWGSTMRRHATGRAALFKHIRDHSSPVPKLLVESVTNEGESQRKSEFVKITHGLRRTLLEPGETVAIGAGVPRHNAQSRAGECLRI